MNGWSIRWDSYSQVWKQTRDDRIAVPFSDGIVDWIDRQVLEAFVRETHAYAKRRK